MIRPLLVLALALLAGAWLLIDLLVHAPSSVIRRWRDRRYLTYWGLESYDEDAQEYVKARLRCAATCEFGVTDEQWREFVEAHSEISGGVS